MKISKNTVAKFHYFLSDNGGQMLDTSTTRDPMEYLHGHGALIKGLEREMEGKVVGDKFHAPIKSDMAYGEYKDELVHIVPKNGFQQEEGTPLEVGLQVQVETNGGIALALVTKIEGEEVTLDLNHPLAGMDLNFEIEILEVRSASDEEISNGHPEGTGEF